jgi:hypothetical protein
MMPDGTDDSNLPLLSLAQARIALSIDSYQEISNLKYSDFKKLMEVCISRGLFYLKCKSISSRVML